MNLTTGFNKFLEKVNLDKTRIDRLISAHKELREALRANDEIKKYYKNDYLQGSYALKLGIKPISRGEYDVDIILELDLKNSDGNYIMDGSQVFYWLYEILSKMPAYRDKVEYPTKKRAIRIKYAKDLRLDISPVHFKNEKDPVEIVPDWKLTNPRGFKQYCIDTNKASFNQFYYVTRLLKYLRDIQLGSGSHPKSILLTTLISKHISTKEGITLNQALVLTMESLNKYLQGLDDVPEVCNPSLKSENLSEHWSYGYFYDFKNMFDNATKKAREAYNEKDEQKTIELLNSDDLFKGNFPVTLYEAEIKKAMDLSESIKANKIGVTATGVLSSVKSQIVSNVPPNLGSHGDFE
ncbi:MAG: hypothetical protein EHM58_01395 [Ignavibacteriae bacterium]|nr:MAG: hypothetical protein EHM58_01395 [Ignavibacteriota bacterium]